MLQALIHARKLVADGWLQGSSITTRGGHVRHCLAAALDMAAKPESTTGYDDVWYEKYRRLYRIVLTEIQGFYGLQWGAIERWNDNLDRTHDQVLALLDRIILRLRCEQAKTVQQQRLAQLWGLPAAITVCLEVNHDVVTNNSEACHGELQTGLSPDSGLERAGERQVALETA